MKHFLASVCLSRLAIIGSLAAATFVAPACSILRPGPEGIDPALVADDIELIQKDVLAAASLATPATRARVEAIAVEVEKVEVALRAAAVGGPVRDVVTAARAAIELVDALVPMPADGSTLKAALVLARIVLNHVENWRLTEAAEAAEDRA